VNGVDEGPAAGEQTAPASIVWRGRLDWADTDAAGIAHWTAVFRMVERAEAALFTALGQAEVFGTAPRTAVEVRYRSPLRFNDPVEVELTVRDVRASTFEYSFIVRGPERVAATGKLGVCIVDPQQMKLARIPAELRELLIGGGQQG
jgi:acyl-CoA thioesterase FadM